METPIFQTGGTECMHCAKVRSMHTSSTENVIFLSVNSSSLLFHDADNSCVARQIRGSLSEFNNDPMT